jgi:quercetin dioxygenase-like cupin family protein
VWAARRFLGRRGIEGRERVQVLSSAGEHFDARRHVEKILASMAGGDVSVAYWEPGQVSPYHCHPSATEIYFCVAGGGVMRTPEAAVAVAPGLILVHPPGELHEYANGPQRTVLFRVRYGAQMTARTVAWRGNAQWRQTPEDAAYFRDHSASTPA